MGRPAAGPARLVEAGVVDRAFCEAVTGREFDSAGAAARHFLRESRGAHPPHPLIDLDRLPAWVRESLGRGEAGPLLRFLRGKGSSRRLGPLFDAAQVPGTPQEKAGHPGGALGLFLETADESTALPGAAATTLGESRAALIERARLIQTQVWHARSRVLDDWDHEAEERWRARWATAPVPHTDNGPLVSVVIPVRNRAGMVGTAIESVLAQTLTDWELIVVDDGSTDDTVEVLERWAARDGRIRVVAQEWSGVSAARNRGLDHALGAYLAFLDSDNSWRPDFLRLAVTAMHAEGLRAAYAAMALHEESRVRYRAHPYSFDDLLVQNYIDPNVLVVERALARDVGGFDEGLRRWVDYDFALRLGREIDLELLPFVAVDYDASLTTADRITTSEAPYHQFVVLNRQWVDWESVRAAVGERAPGRLSVVVATHDDSAATTRCVQSVLRNTPDVDLEVVIVDNASQPHVGISLAAAFLGDPRVHYIRLPRDLERTVGSNVGFASSSGERVLFLSDRAKVRPGWWSAVARHLEDPSVLGIQPLLLRGDDTILSAGTVFPVADTLPCSYLEGHPPEDAEKIPDPRLRAISSAAMVVRAADLAALNGLDPQFVGSMDDVDLCLRLADHRAGHFVLEPRSWVNVDEAETSSSRFEVENRRRLWLRWRGRLPAEADRWTEAGFTIVHYDAPGVPFPNPRPVAVRLRTGSGSNEAPAGALRWGIATSAGGGEGGESWGDTHFAGSLAAALRSLGEDVVTHRRGAPGEAARHDDVFLALRGFFRINPVPGKLNVLWVISHPDDVAPEELEGFDLVYAASAPWAEKMSRVAGRPVEVMLQATDLRRHDFASPLGSAGRPVFVGNTNPRRPRQVVLDAVAAGVALDVHGKGWGGTVAEPHWRSEYFANDGLMALYRSHGLVIADHWDDMAREGFLANRLFDAVAAGARVVSDPVPGLEEFGGAVQAYSSAEELAVLCGPRGRNRFPDDEEMRVIADRVATDHSFDRRAADLHSAARQVAARRHA